MSWLAGPAQAWNAQLGDIFARASESVQRLAEQAELQQLGDKVRGSVQILAEHSEAAFRDATSALGLAPESQEDAPGYWTRESLARRFAAEVRSLQEAQQGGPSPAEIFQRWHARLTREGDTGRTALAALHASRALPDALAALTRTKAGRAVLRAAAEAGGPGAGLPAAAPGGGLPPEVEAGRLLRLVLVRASPAPQALLVQLLQLLGDASRALAHARKASGGQGVDVLEQDVQWVLALLSAALTDSAEAGVRDSSRQVETVERAMQVLEAARSLKPASSPSTASVPQEGAEVWAEWPADGRWYRARVLAASGDDGRAEVEWLQPPSDLECGRDAEYLAAGGGPGDGARRSTLQLAAAVEGGGERPSPAAAAEDTWVQQLDTAEGLSRSFGDLRLACTELGAPVAGSQQRPSRPSQGQGADAAGKALAATLASLAALRDQNARRAEELKAAGVAGAGGSSAATPVAPEPEADEASKEARRAHVAELRRERAELVARLAAIDEELAKEEAEVGKARHRDGEVGAAVERRRLLIEAAAASQDIEALLATRQEQVATLEAAQATLHERRPQVAAACLECETMRRRRLEELVSGIHAAVWGPNAEALGQDVARMAAVRAAIGRAGTVVEHAWREMVQLAADSLGDGGALDADSEDMSRAAKRYKEMRQELGASLDRLAKLEQLGRRFEPAPRLAPQAPAAASSSAPPLPGTGGQQEAARSQPPHHMANGGAGLEEDEAVAAMPHVMNGGTGRHEDREAAEPLLGDGPDELGY